MKTTATVKVSLPTDREIVITREFDVPRRLVFEAMTKPDLLSRWLLGPPGWSMVDCESDLKVGGAFLHRWRHADGKEMAMRGVYREIVTPERIVRTETFDMGCDAQSGEQLATVVLTEEGGKRRSRSRCRTRRRRPATRRSPLGWNEGLPRATTTLKGCCTRSTDGGSRLDRADRGPAGEAA